MNKHDANIKKGRLINIQIGIIAAISFCYVMHEVSHYTTPSETTFAALEEEEPFGPVLTYEEPVIVVPAVKKVVTVKPKQPKIEPAAKPEEIDNTTKTETIEEKITPTEPTTETTKEIKEKDSGETKKTPKINKAIPKIHSSRSVDMLPIFPGCDKYSSNNERAVCFQDKIQRMIYKKFDRSIGDDLGISGTQRISLYFEIDENGNVSNIKARSQHPEFITEAKRVAKLLPEMEPARRKGEKVKMAYNVPIIFKTNN